MHLKEICREDVGWIQLAQDSVSGGMLWMRDETSACGAMELVIYIALYYIKYLLSSSQDHENKQ
jgi:hypothetical protein